MKKEFYYKSYRNACDILYHNLDKLIKNEIFLDKKVYMFGYSRIICMIVGYLKERNIDLCGIIDNSEEKQGKVFDGLMTYKPEIIEKFDKNIIVVIASSYQDEMTSQLENMGYIDGKNIIKVVDMRKLMSDYSFSERSGFRKMPNEEVRKRMLKIMTMLKKVCDDNDIEYFLGYGTLLGAVRHKGFIPWDDDVDILINGDKIDKLAEIINQSDYYEMITCRNCEYYQDNMAIITEKNSAVDLNIFPYQASLGVMIDIFPLYGVPKDLNELNQCTSYLKSMELKKLNAFYDERKCHELALSIDDELRKRRFKDAEYIGFMIGPYLTADHHNKEKFLEKTNLEFEGEMFNVPGNYQDVLKNIYGNYMELPPENKRNSTHYYNAYFLD